MSGPAEFSIDVFARELALAPHGGLRGDFARMARDHATSIYSLAIRLTGNRADAEDLVQETFLKAWRGIGDFEGRSRPRTWLVRILLNTARDRARRAPAARLADEPAAAGIGDTGDRVARRETLGRVLDAVSDLPPRQREVLLLRARGGLSYREIAEVLGIGEGAVKTHLVTARRKLLRRFGREAAE